VLIRSRNLGSGDAGNIVELCTESGEDGLHFDWVPRRAEKAEKIERRGACDTLERLR
jgi:hypothetical protein